MDSIKHFIWKATFDSLDGQLLIPAKHRAVEENTSDVCNLECVARVSGKAQGQARNRAPRHSTPYWREAGDRFE